MKREIFRLLLACSALPVFCCGCAGGRPTPTGGGAETAPSPQVPGIDIGSVDRSADPCQDFYAFACGGWMKTHEIPPDKARWGNFDELAETNLKMLDDICQAAAAGKSEPEDRFGQKVGDFYAACMDEGGIEKTGLGDLNAEWARLDAIKNAASLAPEVARLHERGVGVLFILASEQDFRDSEQVIAWIYQGGLTLPDRDYYLKEDEKSAGIRAAYLAYLARMLELTGLPADQAGSQARSVFELEKAMAESHWTRTEMRDPHRIYNPSDRAGLEKSCPRFGWREYVEALGQAFVRRYFPGDSKQRVLELIGNIQRSMRANLQTLVWMDDTTRRAALAKLGAVSNKIGKPVDRGEWYMSPPTVNAYYNPQLNEMVFPAGILRPGSTPAGPTTPSTTEPSASS